MAKIDLKFKKDPKKSHFKLGGVKMDYPIKAPSEIRIEPILFSLLIRTKKNKIH